MKPEQILGIVRHTLTFIGGILATMGYIDENIAMEIVGGLSTIIGGIWSIVDKRKENTK